MNDKERLINFAHTGMLNERINLICRKLNLGFQPIDCFTKFKQHLLKILYYG